jgi:23S rRNA (guanosine2251-2'-O)-methyltransferase
MLVFLYRNPGHYQIFIGAFNLVSKNKFTKLNIKQKIYKLTSSIRECEKSLTAQGKTDTSDLDSYLKFLKEEEDHPKIKKALEIIQKHFLEINPGTPKTLIIKAYNLCFHELLDLLGEPIKEEYYEQNKVKFFDNKTEKKTFDTVAILDNIRSPFNVGSIFRTSDCLGIKELALCGITPHPPSAKIDRTSMGTNNIVEWKYFPDTQKAINFYREEGYKILGVETVENSTPVFDVDNFEKTALVFGNEEFGITEDILILCGGFIEIPLMGVKNSMNVANAFSIIGYEVMKKGLKS